MAHIQLPPGLPGIRGLLVFRPETAKPMGELADALLHAPNTLSPGDRELIAASREAPVDHLGLSFVYNVEDIREHLPKEWASEKLEEYFKQ